MGSIQTWMQNNVLFHNFFYRSEAITTKEYNKKTLLVYATPFRYGVTLYVKNVLSLSDADSKILLKWDDEFKNVWTDQYSATILIYVIHMRW